MNDHTPTGEPGFVRDATAADAGSIAAIQRTCWRHDHKWPESVFDALAASDPELQWARAVIAPPGPGYRLLVATEGIPSDAEVMGFAALAPSADADALGTDAEIIAWEVRPDARNRGHGSRLLTALADHARSVGAHALSIWIEPSDDHRQHVLRTSGFGPDGAHREVAPDDETVPVTQVRLQATL
jgi:ribosomal protein S18 acetylase RimI-like enzyme